MIENNDFIHAQSNPNEQEWDQSSHTTDGGAGDSHREYSSSKAQVVLGKQFYPKTKASADQSKYSPGSAATSDSKNSNMYSKLNLKPGKIDIGYKTTAGEGNRPAYSKPPTQPGRKADSELNFKLMPKPHEAGYSVQDFQLIEEALHNIEAMIPQNPKRVAASSLITQKQIVESLERVSQASKIHTNQNFEDQNHIYRLLLKIHVQLEKIKQPLSVSQQVQIMLKFLNYEISKIETKLLADQTYQRCLLQKTFLSFMLNMTGGLQSSRDSRQHDVTFRISNSNSEARPKGILKSSANKSLMSPNVRSSIESPQRSPDRDEIRQSQKENSPVRNFLDDTRKESLNQFSLMEIQDSLESQPIQQSLMFDNKISLDSNQFQVLGKKTSDNFLLLLRCMRSWKEFTKQQIVQRADQEKEMLLQKKQRHSVNQSINEMSLEYSRETNMAALANAHYCSQLATKGISSLIIFVVEEQKKSAQICEHLCDLQDYNLKRRTMQSLKAFRVRSQRFYEIKANSRDIYRFKMLAKLFGEMKNYSAKTSATVKKFTLKQNWKKKANIFEQVFIDLLVQQQNNSEKACQYRTNKLEIKVIKSLQSTMNQKQQVASDFDNDRRLNQSLLILNQWSKIAEANRGTREIATQAKYMHKEWTKVQYFNLWRDLAQQAVYGQSIREQFIKKIAFKSIRKFNTMKQKKQLILTACRSHILSVHLKSLFVGWRQQVQMQQNFRNFQLGVYSHFDQFRMRQVFKSWFNQIDILKRWRSLNDNTQAWHGRKMRRRVFKAWKKEIRLKKSFFQVADAHLVHETKFWLQRMASSVHQMQAFRHMSAKHSKSVRVTLFKEWLNLLDKHKIFKINRFYRTREARAQKAAFSQIKSYTSKKIEFKQGMKALLKLRANNIMHLAFHQGLKKMWHQRVIERNLRQASEYALRARLLRKSVRVLRKRMLAGRNRKAVLARHMEIQKKHYLKTWLKRYIIGDVANRFLQRTASNLKFKIYEQLNSNRIQNKTLRAHQQRFEQVHNSHLLARCFSLLKTYKKDRQAKKRINEKYQDRVHKVYQAKESFSKLKAYWEYKQMRKSQSAKFTKKGQQATLRHVVSALRGHLDLVRRLKFFTLRRRASIQQKCMIHLQIHGIKEIKARSMIEKQLLRSKAMIFDGLHRYMRYRVFFSQKQDEVDRVVCTAVKRKYLNRLRKWKRQSQIDKIRASQAHMLRAKSHLRAWREIFLEAGEERKERQMAKRLFAKHMFDRLRRGSTLYMLSEGRKGNLQKQQREFHEFNSKRRAIQLLFKNMNAARIGTMQSKFTRRVMLKKIFNGWYDTLDQLKRERVLRETATVMWNNVSLERCFKQLRAYAQKRIRNQSIIDQFQERTELSLKAGVLMHLHQNIQFIQAQKEQFYSQIYFLAEKRMAPAMEQWKASTELLRMEAKADEFYMKRKAQFLYRLSYDSIRVHSLKQKQKTMQNDAIDGWYGKILLQRAMLGLKSATFEQRRLNNVRQIIGMTSGMGMKRTYFDALQEGLSYRKQRKEIKDKAECFYRQNTYRKCLISFQLSQYQKQLVKTVKTRSNQRTEQEFLQKWRRQLKVSKQLQRVVRLLQDQEDSKIAHKFFPQLVETTFFDQIARHILQKRLQTYQQEFLTELRKRILQKKILRSFTMKSQFDLKRSIIVYLRINARDNKRHKKIIKTHLTAVEEENNFDVLQISFNCLKERVVRKKFNYISANCYRLKVIRKFFFALQQHELRRKIERNNALEIRKIQEAKYLWHWRQAYIKEREKNQASEFIQTTVQYKILQFWRMYADKRIRARNFHKNVVQRNKMSYCLQAWQSKISNDKRLRELGAALKESSIANQKRTIMYGWLQNTQELKIEKQMTKFNELKVMRGVVSSWRQIKDAKNQKRRSVYLIREQLQAKPELARPLKVLKNNLLFRAFNKLIEGAALVYDEAQMTEMANTQHYVSTIKKTFLCLKLNSQLEHQQNDVTEIADLFLKRRWLNYIKLGAQYLKDRRKLRHKASIFRFLSLQKTALQMLVAHSISNQERRIKQDFAMQLYYKRLLDQALCGLKVYKDYKVTHRQARFNRRSELDKERSASRSVSADIRAAMDIKMRKEEEQPESMNISAKRNSAEFGEYHFDEEDKSRNSIVNETSQFERINAYQLDTQNSGRGRDRKQNTFASSELNPNVYSYGENTQAAMTRDQGVGQAQRASIQWGNVGNAEQMETNQSLGRISLGHNNSGTIHETATSPLQGNLMTLGRDSNHTSNILMQDDSDMVQAQRQHVQRNGSRQVFSFQDLKQKQ